MADGRAFPHVITTNFCMVDKRGPNQREEILAADPTGTAVTNRFNLIKLSQETIQQQEEQGDGGVHFQFWGYHRGGGQSRGRLTPEVIVTIGGDTCLVWLLPSSKIDSFVLPAPDDEQQILITNEYGGDQVLAGRRELLDLRLIW